VRGEAVAKQPTGAPEIDFVERPRCYDRSVFDRSQDPKLHRCLDAVRHSDCSGEDAGPTMVRGRGETATDGKETAMRSNPVGWFEIYVQDMPRARAFYESVFEISLEKLNGPEVEMLAFPMSMDATGAAGALVRMPGVASGGNSVLVYFSCEDCAVEESRVKAAGGRVERSKMSIGEYGFISLVYDTEGNLFGLHSRQ
jgi:predicted enzyme related to lactoylglutathione lyase